MGEFKPNKSDLKVCYFGTYRAEYSRNQIMIAGLRSAGVEVIECHVPLWTGIEDRVEAVSGGWFKLSFIKRLVSTYWRLIKKYAALDKNYDVMVLGYPGQLDVFLARLLTWFHRKPLIMDMFMSIYLIALERGLDKKSAISISLLRLLERIGCHLPNLLICDTSAYLNWHVKTHHLNPKKFRLVPTGADDRFFQPQLDNTPPSESFRVLYYGTYIPNHNVEIMIEAANLLKETPAIQFEFVGDGPDRAGAIELAEHYNLENVTFTNWIEKEALPAKIGQAHLLLGVFGQTPQSIMTVQNKIYEALAMGKPIITGTAPTVKEALIHGEQTYLVERNNSQALADGILALYQNPALRHKIAKQGKQCFEEKYSVAKLGAQFKLHLLEVVADTHAQ